MYAEPDIQATSLPDGGMLLRSRTPLAELPRNTGVHLTGWAERTPDRPLFIEPDPRTGEERMVSYGGALSAARSIGQALLDRGLGGGRGQVSPGGNVAILSGNGIDHALIALAGQLIGVPIAPVSVAYSTRSTGFGRLRAILELLRPAVVFCADPDAHAAALHTVGDLVGELVCSTPPADGRIHTPLAALLDTTPTDAVDDAADLVGPDNVAKVLFTSGSTGAPKGVPTTHRMLLANQVALQQIWPFLVETPPVLVDWLPWSHTFGGSHNTGLVIANGGTMVIDHGRPAPGLLDVTLANLRRHSPTIAFNVPAGYAALLPHLERDDALARAFFDRLQLIFYAAAALPQDTWTRLEQLSRRVTGDVVPMTSAWGSTETAPLATAAHLPLRQAGNIGVPVPGVEIKLVPSGSKLELRVRGPNVFAGYLGEGGGLDRRGAFDADGFYRIGDAGRLDDPDQPAAGLVFDGRIAEDFKLGTGTWVSVGRLRVDVLTVTAPAVADVVVTGHDRDAIGLLVWLDQSGAAEVAGLDPASTMDELAAHPALRRHLAEGLIRHNATAGGSSRTIERFTILVEPPSIEHGEITDKGYINQSAVLRHRADAVTRLHAVGAHEDVMVLSPLRSTRG